MSCETHTYPKPFMIRRFFYTSCPCISTDLIERFQHLIVMLRLSMVFHACQYYLFKSLWYETDRRQYQSTRNIHIYVIANNCNNLSLRTGVCIFIWEKLGTKSTHDRDKLLQNKLAISWCLYNYDNDCIVLDWENPTQDRVTINSLFIWYIY